MVNDTQDVQITAPDPFMVTYPGDYKDLAYVAPRAQKRDDRFAAPWLNLPRTKKGKEDTLACAHLTQEYLSEGIQVTRCKNLTYAEGRTGYLCDLHNKTLFPRLKAVPLRSDYSQSLVDEIIAGEVRALRTAIRSEVALDCKGTKITFDLQDPATDVYARYPRSK